MANFVFFARTHVNEQWAGNVTISRHPLGKFLCAHLGYCRPIFLDRGEHGVPGQRVRWGVEHPPVDDACYSNQQESNGACDLEDARCS
jgi:hypothetical protein